MKWTECEENAMELEEAISLLKIYMQFEVNENPAYFDKKAQPWEVYHYAETAVLYQNLIQAAIKTAEKVYSSLLSSAEQDSAPAPKAQSAS